MELAAIIVLASAVLGLAALLVLSARSRQGRNLQDELAALRKELQDSISANTRHIDAQLTAVTGQVSEQLSSVTAQLNSSTGQISARMEHAARAVSDVRQGLGELSRATAQVFEVGRSITGLERILSAPKARGGLGELFLGDLLSEMLPSSRYALQHTFSDGARVDAAVILKDGMVPVDSKFPLENFRRIVEAASEDERRASRKRFAADCRRHIDAIASSYIRPREGTLPLALMYIPSEGVYYEFITTATEPGEKTLSEYALSKRVVAVSPNSFYAYLETVLLGLKGLEIGERAEEVMAHLSVLRDEFGRFFSDLETLGKHLSFARSKYEEVERKARRFGDRLDLGSPGKEIEPA